MFKSHLIQFAKQFLWWIIHIAAPFFDSSGCCIKYPFCLSGTDVNTWVLWSFKVFRPCFCSTCHHKGLWFFVMLQPISDRLRSWRKGGAGRPNKYTKAKTINQIQFNGYFYVWFRCFLLACSLQAMCALDHISIATCAGNENLALHLPVAAVKVASKLKTISTVCCKHLAKQFYI